jgi:hypothetical protein
MYIFQAHRTDLMVKTAVKDGEAKVKKKVKIGEDKPYTKACRELDMKINKIGKFFRKSHKNNNHMKEFVKRNGE